MKFTEKDIYHTDFNKAESVGKHCLVMVISILNYRSPHFSSESDLGFMFGRWEENDEKLKETVKKLLKEANSLKKYEKSTPKFRKHVIKKFRLKPYVSI